MAREVRGGSTLSGMESVMWRLEADHALSAAFGTVSFLDRAPDRRRLEQRMARAVAAVPRLRQRIRPAPVPGLPPSWEDDPGLDLAAHLRWVELDPTPAADADALDAAARLVATPFEPDRPLWEFRVLTGLPGGRAALIQRMHHAVTDGEGGVRLSEQFIDAERDAPEPPPDAFVGPDAVEPHPTWVERAVVTVTGAATDVARGTVAAARWTVDGLADPERFARAGGDAVEAVSSLRRQLLVVDAAHSPLWAGRSTDRRLVVATLPFGPIRAAATEAGVSVNVVFVTAVLRGAAAYHRAKGEPVDQLRAAVPVSTRHDGSAGGNAFSPMRALLPSGDGLTAAAHLHQVADRLAGTTHERSTTLMGSLAGAAELVPTPVLVSLFRRQAATIDVVTSNLRTAPFPLYVAGARIEATYALGPIMGTPVNVTMMSYADQVDLGIHVDPAAIDDPDLLRDTIVGAFHEVSARS